MEAVNTKNSFCLFIDARVGTSKTFALNANLAEIRLFPIETESAIALATGTTGVASNLLYLGKTFHSRFKAPLSPHEDSVLAIDVQSNLADLIRKARIIVIDAAQVSFGSNGQNLERHNG